MRIIFFLLIFAACVIPLISDAAAQTQRYRDYQVEDLGDGTFRQTLGMQPYVWNGSEFVDRIISNNGTHFNVYSEMGSFSFSKSTCSVTQYVQGFNPISGVAGQSDIVVGDWFWTIARKNGANPWEVIDPNMFGCSISTSSNSTGKYLTMTRTDAGTGSYLKVTLAAPNGQPVEDHSELYMNVPAWNGNKFAFVLQANGAKVDSIVLRNGTAIPLQQGYTVIDRSQLSVNSLDFIKNGNAFFLDWSKSASLFKTLTINKTASTDIQIGFNNNAQSMTTGSKIHMDPTYGYTFATDQVYVRTVASVATTCGAASSTNTVDYQTQLPGSGVNGVCIVAGAQWDVSSIPPGVTVSSVDLKWTVNAVGSMSNCDINQVTNDITTASAAVLWTDINNGNLYVKDTATCTTATAGKTLNLGTNATGAMQSTITGTDKFALGYTYHIITRDGTTRTSNWVATGANNFQLQVTYALGPADSITTLAASSIQSDQVDLTWTAPNLNGGTLQRYVMNYTTPCGIPLTPLTNGTTATTYTVSSLTSSTCYSFRASAATEGGYNTTAANIVNVTTLAFNQANFTVGSLNFDATNPDQVSIWFTKTVNSATNTTLTVTYPNTWNLACDFHYQFAMTNQTYSNLTQTVVSSTHVSSEFDFTDPGNDVIDVLCWDQGDLLHNGKYILTQADFVFLNLLQNFTGGEYGTHGNFGSIDIIFLFAIIISMIGLNRINESVGAAFCIMIMGGLAYFEIIQWETFAMASVALVVLAIILSTRKD